MPQDSPTSSFHFPNYRDKHVTDTNSGHEIHKEQPQLVIDAIREVVEAVRSAGPAACALRSA